ncbi:MAG: ParB N-terminal domain-containing protein [Chloroflexi bacterium]|nr:ParB N-terminal domain-containing protein [Chloroflexota bacterium]
MAKKRTGLSQTLFDGIDPYGQTAAQTESESRLIYLPLTAVRPDPKQPRRLLPGNLQATLVEQGVYDPVTVMRSWLAQAAPGDTRLLELRKLAESIAQHGLINPITIRALEAPLPDGSQYLIVTGERRYWAHVLLAAENRRLQVGEQADPNQIQALLAQSGISIRAHQLIENINREDINALEKAQGLLALRQELSGVNPGSPPFPAGEDAPKELIPWTEVSSALGISARYRIYLTAVLDLCAEAQAIIAAHDLAEKTIRPIAQKLKERPDLQVEALQQMVAWQRDNESEDGVDHAVNNKAVSVLVNQLLARENPKGRAARLHTAPHIHTFQQTIKRTLRFLTTVPPEDLLLVARDLALDQTYQETAEELEALETQLAALRQQVEKYRQE